MSFWHKTGREHVIYGISGGFDVFLLSMDISVLEYGQIRMAADCLERLHGDIRPLCHCHADMPLWYIKDKPGKP